MVAREGEGGAALRGRRWTVLAGSLRGDWGLSGSDLSGTQPRFCEYTSTLLALVLDLGPRYLGPWWRASCASRLSSNPMRDLCGPRAASPAESNRIEPESNRLRIE